jgi:hypothetical protein
MLAENRNMKFIAFVNPVSVIMILINPNLISTSGLPGTKKRSGNIIITGIRNPK